MHLLEQRHIVTKRDGRRTFSCIINGVLKVRNTYSKICIYIQDLGREPGVQATDRMSGIRDLHDLQCFLSPLHSDQFWGPLTSYFISLWGINFRG
jgi:hypothetical protein